jgi:hypothetical protein
MMHRPASGNARYLLLGLGLTLALSLCGASVVAADVVPSVVVTDEGPGVVNTTGVNAGVGGTCTDVYEAQQANGIASCSAASWPGPGGQWSPTLTISEGDTLRLTFSGPVSDVTVASTTNYPVGLMDPSGKPVPNSDIISPTSATATANPTTWTVQVPNPLSALASSPVPFAVVADDAGEAHDYYLSIQKPHCYGTNEASQPGSFPCGIPPGVAAPGEPVSIGSPPGPGSTPHSGSAGQPSIRILGVKRERAGHYRIVVIASGAGTLNLVWLQHTRRVARLSRALAAGRTVFDARVGAVSGARLRVVATFRARGGGVARATFAGL